MPSADGYNGWANYETWVVNLWLTNNEVDSTFAFAAAQQGYDELKEYVELHVFGVKDRPSTLATDLLNAAIGSVHWHELSTSLLDRS